MSLAPRLRAAAVVVLFAWSLASVTAIGAPFWSVPLVVIGLVGVAWAMGHGALSFAGVRPLLPLTGRFVVGLPIVAVSATLLSQVGLARFAPPILVLAAMAALVYGRRDLAHAGDAGMGSWEVLSFAVLFRLFAFGSDYLSIGATQATFNEYWDFMWQLAMLKEGVFRGLPLAQYPLMGGGPPLAYHPAFLSMATVTLQWFPKSVGPLFFGAILPVMYTAFVAAIVFSASEIARHAKGGLYALGLLVASLAFGQLPTAITSRLGDGGSMLFVYFLLNIPSLLAAVALMAVFGIVASDSRRTRPWVAAAAIAGGILAIKAPVAVAGVPAVMLGALLVRGSTRDRLIRGAFTGVVAVAVALACLPVISGQGAPIAVRLGMLADSSQHTLMTVGGPLVMRGLASSTIGAGVPGDVVFLAGFCALALLGWRALPFLASRPLAERRKVARLRDDPLFRLLGLFTLFTVIIGLTLVQPDTGRFASWQVGLPPLRNLTWFGLLLGGAALAPLVARLDRPRRRSVEIAAMVLVVALALPASLTILKVRGTQARPFPADLARLLLEVERSTPVDAVVVQLFDNEYNALAAGISGRRTVLERGEFSRAYFPRETALRDSVLAELTDGSGTAEARQWLAEHPVDLVIRARGESAGSSSVLFEAGDWVAVRPDIALR